MQNHRLHMQNQQQHAQCTGLHARVVHSEQVLQQMQAQNQQLQTQCAGLYARVAQNEELQQRVAAQLVLRVAVLEPLAAALQPLAGRVRALEGDAEAGRQRQRQRVGPAPHDDATPSSAAVTQMELVAAVAALRAQWRRWRWWFAIGLQGCASRRATGSLRWRWGPSRRCVDL